MGRLCDSHARPTIAGCEPGAHFDIRDAERGDQFPCIPCKAISLDWQPPLRRIGSPSLS
jgi:hypothetical protein